MPKNRLSYQSLETKFPIEKNEIVIWVRQLKLVHKINWVNYEDCGSSSFYFHILEEDDVIGGVKLFNNTKAVVFVYRVDEMHKVINACEALQEKVGHFLAETGGVKDKGW